MAKADNKQSYLKSILIFFKKNWLMLLICFAVAIVMWGLVLKSENPERKKIIKNVPITLDGEADLLSRYLVVSGSKSEIFQNVTVKVSIDLLRYSSLSADDITAVANLRKIQGEGKYELSINATTSQGTVVSVNPNKITVNIESLKTKKIPVEITTTGSSPSGYSTGNLAVSTKSIEIKGANSVISNIEKATYEVDLSTTTESLNKTVSLDLIDINNTPVSYSLLYGEVPSVNITMPVYMYKDINLSADDFIINKDLINANYEIVNTNISPQTVRIYSEDYSLISELKTVNLSNIDVMDATETISQQSEIELPKGMWTDDETKSVNVQVFIREKQQTLEFSDLTIRLENKDKDYKYTLSQQKIDIKITCGVLTAKLIEQGNIVVYANVSNLSPSQTEYEIKLSYKIHGLSDEKMQNLEFITSPETVKIKVTG